MHRKQIGYWMWHLLSQPKFKTLYFSGVFGHLKTFSLSSQNFIKSFGLDLGFGFLPSGYFHAFLELSHPPLNKTPDVFSSKLDASLSMGKSYSATYQRSTHSLANIFLHQRCKMTPLYLQGITMQKYCIPRCNISKISNIPYNAIPAPKIFRPNYTPPNELKLSGAQYYCITYISSFGVNPIWVIYPPLAL